MRPYIDQEGKKSGSTQGYNKLTQEAGTFSITNKEKISSYSVVQSFIVEWQMQVLDLKK